jgi:hypothetical protein
VQGCIIRSYDHTPYDIHHTTYDHLKGIPPPYEPRMSPIRSIRHTPWGARCMAYGATLTCRAHTRTVSLSLSLSLSLSHAHTHAHALVFEQAELREVKAEEQRLARDGPPPLEWDSRRFRCGAYFLDPSGRELLGETPRPLESPCVLSTIVTPTASLAQPLTLTLTPTLTICAPWWPPRARRHDGLDDLQASELEVQRQVRS